MARTVVGVTAGFFTWLIVWVGVEKLLSAMWPAFGAHQQAFEAAIEHGGVFTVNASHLLIQLVLGSLAAVIAGYIAALIARESTRAPLVTGFLIAAIGVLKAVFSWPYVPVWHHGLFVALLLPMTMVGGRMRGAK